MSRYPGVCANRGLERSGIANAVVAIRAAWGQLVHVVYGAEKSEDVTGVGLRQGTVEDLLMRGRVFVFDSPGVTVGPTEEVNGM